MATVLAIAGILTSVYGIAQEHMKPMAIGLVLIFGSGVFATLYLARAPTNRALTDVPPMAAHGMLRFASLWQSGALYVGRPMGTQTALNG